MKLRLWPFSKGEKGASLILAGNDSHHDAATLRGHETRTIISDVPFSRPPRHHHSRDSCHPRSLPKNAIAVNKNQYGAPGIPSRSSRASCRSISAGIFTSPFNQKTDLPLAGVCRSYPATWESLRVCLMAIIQLHTRLPSPDVTSQGHGISPPVSPLLKPSCSARPSSSRACFCCSNSL